MEKKIIVKELQGRIIAISDIHGYYQLFNELLDKVQYTSQDNLVIIGDYIEKGPNILETIWQMMNLSKNQNVYILNGNNEWAIFEMVYRSYHLKRYLNNVTNSIFHEVFKKNQINYKKYDELTLKILAHLLLKKELSFINSLPVLLKTKDYLFVHAGIEEKGDFNESSLSSLLEQRYFLNKLHSLKEYVVVGHLPVSNYHFYHIDNRIIIDEEKKMIGIDGGMGIKMVCQLNALVIDNGFTKFSVRPYQKQKVIKAYYPEISFHHKISWPNYEVIILKKGKEFSMCQKVFNKEKLMIKNEFLYKKDNAYYCKDDYIDHKVNVEINDIVDLIGLYGEYAYIIKQDEVGWILRECLEN